MSVDWRHWRRRHRRGLSRADTKLDREVAIKVLPDNFALTPTPRAIHARSASPGAVNHPNVAAIYGVEEQGGTRALVMELVDGEDLAQVLTRGAIALTDALPVASQIAEALEAAHEQGIVHRDLKPANIILKGVRTPPPPAFRTAATRLRFAAADVAGCTVKVLDFGLAKAVSPAEPHRSAITPSSHADCSCDTDGGHSRHGGLHGAGAGEGPRRRQAGGYGWIGAVLYEMLAGERAFKGGDVTEVLASVLKDTVDFGALPAGVPARLKELIGRCLERDPRKRQRDAGDILLELAAIQKNRDEPAPGGWTTRSGRRNGARRDSGACDWRRPQARCCEERHLQKTRRPCVFRWWHRPGARRGRK